ncbi:MAG: VTT domain-containing protein [Candidatus Bathyarchaeota archaeon]|nr:VTT domain-containing protein [Candidatus Bathyarchaeota archaeon]
MESKQLSFSDWMHSVASQFGYFGVFIISVIGTMAIVIPIPYTVVILLLGMEGWDPLFLTIAGGLGSAIGEFAGYLLGYYGRRIISAERQRRMDYLLKLFGKWSPAAIFIFALTPLPDDLLFIPLGILRYNPLKAFVPAFAGKLLMCYILASFGRVYGDALSVLFGNEGWIGAAVTTVLLVLVIYALYKVDWEKVFDKYVSNKGARAARLAAER